MMAKIIAVCKSREKGTKKEPVVSGIIREDYGLVGDAHADCCTLGISPREPTFNRTTAKINAIFAYLVDTIRNWGLRL